MLSSAQNENVISLSFFFAAASSAGCSRAASRRHTERKIAFSAAWMSDSARSSTSS